MANNMMLAALRGQRQGKMDPQPAPEMGKPADDAGGIEARVSKLEIQLKELAQMIGAEEASEGKEAPEIKQEKY